MASDSKAQRSGATPCQILTCLTVRVKMLSKFKARRADGASLSPLTATAGNKL